MTRFYIWIYSTHVFSLLTAAILFEDAVPKVDHQAKSKDIPVAFIISLTTGRFILFYSLNKIDLG